MKKKRIALFVFVLIMGWFLYETVVYPYMQPPMIREVLAYGDDNSRGETRVKKLCTVDIKDKDNFLIRADVTKSKITEVSEHLDFKRREDIARIIKKYIVINSNLKDAINELTKMEFKVKKNNNLNYFDCDRRMYEDIYNAHISLDKGLIMRRSLWITLYVNNGIIKDVSATVSITSL